jgi:hypothetical protein
MDCPGYYFHAEPGNIFLGSGQYMFSDELLKKYREVIYNIEKVKELDSIIKKLKKKGYRVGGKTFKKVPKGFDPEYPYSEYLLYNGIYLYEEFKDINQFKNEDMIKFSFRKFKEMLPLHQWLVKNI